MTIIEEGDLVFAFPPDWKVEKYDSWAFYRKARSSFQGIHPGTRAVDIIAVSGQARPTLWMIEVKDYRRHCRTKPSDVAEEVAGKVRDTLAGLAAARIRANVDTERDFAVMAMKVKEIRVVLHLELGQKSAKLNPTKLSRADIKQKLSQRLRCVDFRPCVIDGSSTDHVAWNVTPR